MQLECSHCMVSCRCNLTRGCGVWGVCEWGVGVWDVGGVCGCGCAQLTYGTLCTINIRNTKVSHGNRHQGARVLKVVFVTVAIAVLV